MSTQSELQKSPSSQVWYPGLSAWSAEEIVSMGQAGPIEFDNLVYAPMKTSPSDLEGMAAEVLKFRPQMTEAIVSQLWLQPDYYRKYPILGDEEIYAKAYRTDFAIGKTYRLSGGRPTFYAMNFTRNENGEGPNFGLSLRAQMVGQKWSWNPDLPLPKVTSFLENKLGMTEPLLCRALVVEPGGVVPFHTDVGRKEMQSKNFRQINMVLSSGGSPLLIQYKGRFIESNDSVYSFKDLYLHGVPQTKETRVVLVVCGMFDPNVWESQIDYLRTVTDKPAKSK